MKYILILEDDNDLATGIEISLKEKDVQFVICQTIQDAREKIKGQMFDLLIFDVNLRAPPYKDILKFFKWDLNPHVHLRIPFSSAVQTRLLLLKYQYEFLLSNCKILCIP